MLRFSVLSISVVCLALWRGACGGEEENGSSQRQHTEPQPSTLQRTKGTQIAVVGAPGVNVRRKPGGAILKHLGRKTELGSERVLPVVGRRNQWLQVIAPELGNGKVGWINERTSPLTFGSTHKSIHVDLSKRRVKLYRGGEVVYGFNVTVGAFGTNTPTGRFAVTDVFRHGIDPIYGCCVVVLSANQSNLPPNWFGKGRVGIHGWNGPIGRAESAGCLRAKNNDMRRLIPGLKLGTPVFITR